MAAITTAVIGTAVTVNSARRQRRAKENAARQQEEASIESAQLLEEAGRLGEADIARQLAGREFRAGLLGGISAEQQRRLGMLGGIGTQQQALQQRALDIPYQEFQRALAYPTQQLGLLAQGVSAQPQLMAKTAAYQPSSLEGISSALNILSQPFMQNLFSGGGSGGGGNYPGGVSF